MDQAVKEAWVKALRSGDYEQGREGLRNTRDEYCCLGVLCDQWAGSWELSSHYVTGRGKFYDFILAGHSYGMAGSLTLDMRREIGLLDEEESDLISLNDDEDADFDEIADWIEENL